MCDPILVALLKMQPHYSQSSRENATPSSGTSPIASYREVPPPPRDPAIDVRNTRFYVSNQTNLIVTIKGIKRQVQLGVISIKTKTDVIPSDNITKRRGVK